MDADGDTTIQGDTDDQIDFQVAGTDQFNVTDGAVTPSVDNDLDLGSAASEYKDLYIDGVGYIDSVNADTLFVGSADIDAGTIDNVTIGGSTAGTGTFSTLNATSFTASTVNIDGGTIDGAAVGNNSAGAGTFTTLIASTSFATTGDATVSGGDVTVGSGTTAYPGRVILHDGDGGDAFTITLQANDDISADIILTFPADDGTASQSLITDGEGNLSWGAPSGGTGAYDLNGQLLTVDADGDTTIQGDTDDQIDFQVAGTDQFNVTDGAVTPSVDNDLDLGSAASEYKDLYIDGVGYIDSVNADTLYVGSADIDAGTIDNVTIGGTTAGTGDVFNFKRDLVYRKHGEYRRRHD